MNVGRQVAEVEVFSLMEMARFRQRKMELTEKLDSVMGPAEEEAVGYRAKDLPEETVLLALYTLKKNEYLFHN